MAESGIVLVNKPAGISSNAVVNIVKRVLKADKCGHLGTLDLEGEGLLPVTVNKATKLFDYFLNKDKTYQAVFEFGYETDTLDISGVVTKTKPCDISKSELEKVCKNMIGKQLQMPPLYSAKKVGGKVAYKEARKGLALQLQPKEIEIYDIKVVKQLSKNKFGFEISCSSGTYIRSVCRDIAAKLSTYGVMYSILRTRCGVLCIKDAYTLEEIKSGNFKMLPCDILFNEVPCKLEQATITKLCNGQKVPFELEDGRYKLYSASNAFLGIGKVENGLLSFLLRLT